MRNLRTHRQRQGRKHLGGWGGAEVKVDCLPYPGTISITNTSAWPQGKIQENTGKRRAGGSTKEKQCNRKQSKAKQIKAKQIKAKEEERTAERSTGRTWHTPQRIIVESSTRCSPICTQGNRTPQSTAQHSTAQQNTQRKALQKRGNTQQSMAKREQDQRRQHSIAKHGRAKHSAAKGCKTKPWKARQRRAQQFKEKQRTTKQSTSQQSRNFPAEIVPRRNPPPPVYT